MEAENFDTQFLKGLGIEAYRTPAPGEPEHHGPVQVAWPKEAAELIGVPEDVLREWERCEMIELPETQWGPDGSVKMLTSDDIAALRKLKESYARAMILQGELLEERALAKAAKEAGDRWWRKKCELAMRLKCGAKIEDGPLGAKFDGNGGLRVR